ncbi:MAG TPA: hypothetical protein VGA37_03795 [Gemmatimonadales bacterium]
MTEPDLASSVPVRPWPITLICVIGVLAAAVAILVALVQDATGALPRSTAAVPIIVLSVGISLTSLWGYWRMRRWGVWLMTTGLVVTTALTVAAGRAPRPDSMTAPMLMLVIGLAYYRRMR